MSRVLIILLLVLACVDKHMTDRSSDNDAGDHDRILSRKRRYLVFPEGSSIQLVYCFTIPITGNFVFATTAALAWMLPSSADDILLRNRLNITQRIDKIKTTYIKKGSKPKYRQNSTYYKPFTYSTQYMQYPQPIRYHMVTLSPSYRKSYNRKQFPRPLTQNNPYYYGSQNPVRTYVNPVYNELHRRTRRDLFGKIEKFFQAQRKDGKACLLKAVCEVSQVGVEGKGTFIQEIIKAIFRNPPSHTDHEDAYDVAAKTRQNCTELYPSCDFSLWNIL